MWERLAALEPADPTRGSNGAGQLASGLSQMSAVLEQRNRLQVLLYPTHTGVFVTWPLFVQLHIPSMTELLQPAPVASQEAAEKGRSPDFIMPTQQQTVRARALLRSVCFMHL